jgi:hypothetical protein
MAHPGSYDADRCIHHNDHGQPRGRERSVAFVPDRLEPSLIGASWLVRGSHGARCWFMCGQSRTPGNALVGRDAGHFGVTSGGRVSIRGAGDPTAIRGADLGRAIAVFWDANRSMTGTSHPLASGTRERARLFPPVPSSARTRTSVSSARLLTRRSLPQRHAVGGTALDYLSVARRGHRSRSTGSDWFGDSPGS